MADWGSEGGCMPDRERSVLPDDAAGRWSLAGASLPQKRPPPCILYHAQPQLAGAPLRLATATAGHAAAVPARRGTRRPGIDELLNSLGDGLSAAGAGENGAGALPAPSQAAGHVASEPQILLLDGADGGGPEDLDATYEADLHLSRSDVIARVEDEISKAVSSISQGRLPVLSMVSRAGSNVVMQDEEGELTWAGKPADSQPNAGMGSQPSSSQTAGGPNSKRLKLGSKLHQKSLTAGKGAQANSYVRIFAMLEAIHELMRLGKQATQRDLYYKLADHPFFTKPGDVNSAIQDVVALLKVPRSTLGITCASKGSVAGRVCIKDGPAAAWQDCDMMGSAGKAIPGQLSAVEQMRFRVTARYIIVVEKDAIFQRLVEDRLTDALPCVLVTAKGMPDLATRAFLHHLHAAAAPGVSVLGLVDWNPSGVAILCTYKFGNERMGLESSRYALPTLQWLGITSDMLLDVPDDALKPLTQRDKAMLPRLRQRLQECPQWLQQLDDMEGAELKADIEALYTTCGYDGLRKLLTATVLQHKCLA